MSYQKDMASEQEPEIERETEEWEGQKYRQKEEDEKETAAWEEEKRNSETKPE